MIIWAGTPIEGNCVSCGSASSSGNKQPWQTVELPVIPDVITFLWRHCIEIGISLLLCHMDEMLSPTYEIATDIMSHGRVSKSYVWDKYNAAEYICLQFVDHGEYIFRYINPGKVQLDFSENVLHLLMECNENIFIWLMDTLVPQNTFFRGSFRN